MCITILDDSRHGTSNGRGNGVKAGAVAELLAWAFYPPMSLAFFLKLLPVLWIHVQELYRREGGHEG